MPSPLCRFCARPLEWTFCDLGPSPRFSHYLKQEELGREELYPLSVKVCTHCLLVQNCAINLPHHPGNPYVYYSTLDPAWLAKYRELALRTVDQFHLSASSRVIEVGSNDGYLLHYYQELGIPVLGIEPKQNLAQAALVKGIPTLSLNFDRHSTKSLSEKADLLIASQLISRTSDLADSLSTLQRFLKPRGVIILEFPDLGEIIREHRFDRMSHEHLFYFTLTSLRKICAHHHLEIFNVEPQGCSLRLFAKQSGDLSKPLTPSVTDWLEREKQEGLDQLAPYLSFKGRLEKTREKIAQFLQEAHKLRKKVVGFGAPDQGNSFYHYCGLTAKLLPAIVDSNVYKQGKYLPGSHIPVIPPSRLTELRPDYLLILLPQLTTRAIQEYAYIRSWGAQLVSALPTIEVIAA